ncbi:hypothetical protein [Nostoc sp. DSM 114160]
MSPRIIKTYAIVSDRPEIPKVRSPVLISTIAPKYRKCDRLF